MVAEDFLGAFIQKAVQVRLDCVVIDNRVVATLIIIEIVPVVIEARPLFVSLDARAAHVVVFWDNGTAEVVPRRT
jgi:hypothetical protein